MAASTKFSKTLGPPCVSSTKFQSDDDKEKQKHKTHIMSLQNTQKKKKEKKKLLVILFLAHTDIARKAMIEISDKSFNVGLTASP